MAGDRNWWQYDFIGSVCGFLLSVFVLQKSAFKGLGDLLPESIVAEAIMRKMADRRRFPGEAVGHFSIGLPSRVGTLNFARDVEFKRPEPAATARRGDNQWPRLDPGGRGGGENARNHLWPWPRESARNCTG